MILVNSEGVLYQVPDEMLSGLALSNWVDQKKEIRTLLQALSAFVGKMQQFNDNGCEGADSGCCGCASGQSAMMDLCKWER